MIFFITPWDSQNAVLVAFDQCRKLNGRKYLILTHSDLTIIRDCAMIVLMINKHTGRKTKPECDRKKERIAIVLTTQERELLDAAARAEHLATSTWARAILLRVSEQRNAGVSDSTPAV